MTVIYVTKRILLDGAPNNIQHLGVTVRNTIPTAKSGEVLLSSCGKPRFPVADNPVL